MSKTASPDSAFSDLPPDVAFVVSLIQLVSLALLAWIVLSYVVIFGRVPGDHPIRKLYDLLSRAIEPMLRPIRAVIPPVRMGGGALDLSPLILIVGLQILANVLS